MAKRKPSPKEPKTEDVSRLMVNAIEATYQAERDMLRPLTETERDRLEKLIAQFFHCVPAEDDQLLISRALAMASMIGGATEDEDEEIDPGEVAFTLGMAYERLNAAQWANPQGR